MEEEKKKNDPKYKLMMKLLENSKHFKTINRKDEYRPPDAYKDGGFGLTD